MGVTLCLLKFMTTNVTQMFKLPFVCFGSELMMAERSLRAGSLQRGVVRLRIGVQACSEPILRATIFVPLRSFRPKHLSFKCGQTTKIYQKFCLPKQ